MARTTVGLNNAMLAIAAIVVIILLGPPARGRRWWEKNLKSPTSNPPMSRRNRTPISKTIITEGEYKMPGYETKLSKEQIDKLVVFIRDLAKTH